MFRSIFDATNNAVHVACISGCGAIFGTDLSTIDATHQKVVGLDSIPLSAAQPTNGQVYQYNGSQNQWVPATLNSFAASGDLSGSSVSQTVVGLQGKPLAATSPSNNQVLTWNGTSWTPTSPTAGAGTGVCTNNQFVTGVNLGASPNCAQPAFSSLSGAAAPTQLPGATAAAQGALQLAQDLTGTAAAPRVAGLQGNPVSSTTPTSNQVLTWNGATWAPANAPATGAQIAQDLGGTTAAPKVVGLQGNAVSSTAPTSNQVLTWNGATWAPASAPATGAQIAQDLGGTTAAPKVVGFNSVPLSSTAPANGQVYEYNSASNQWQPQTLTTAMGMGSAITGGTSQSLLYVNASNQLAQDNTNLNYNPSSQTLFAQNLSLGGNAFTLGGSGQTAYSFYRLYGSTTTAGGTTDAFPPVLDFFDGSGINSTKLMPDQGQPGMLCVGNSYLTSSSGHCPTSGTAGTGVYLAEGTAPLSVAGLDAIYADSSAHALKVCYNGSACTTLGGSITLQTNGTNDASQTALNLTNSAATNGLTVTATNTSGGTVQLGLTGALSNSGLANSSATVNNQTCTLGASCTVTGGVNVQSGSYTLAAADNGKLVIMNCSSACTATLPSSPPFASWYTLIMSTGGTLAGVSFSGGAQYNGSTAAPLLNSFRPLVVYANGTGYSGDAPLVAGSGVSFTPASNGLTISASGATLQTNGANNTSQTALNLTNSAATNGLTMTATNTSGGTVQLGLTGTLANSGLANSSITLNNQTCALGASCTTSGGVNVQSADYTLTSADNGKLVIMNCSSACTATLPSSPPFASWYARIMSMGSALAAVSLNGAQYNGSTAALTLGSFWPLVFYANGSGYSGDVPLTAGPGITLTPASNGLAISSTGVTLQTNGANNANQTTLNLASSAVSNGLTVTATNTTAGTVQLGLTGTLANSGLANSSITLNNQTCVLGASCTTSGGVNVQSASYTLTSADSGKLVIMNCSSVCTVTLPSNPPFASWYARIMSTGSALAAVSLNGAQYNGSTASPTLDSFWPLVVFANATGYAGDAPLLAGPGVTLTPAANGLTISATGSGGTVTTTGTPASGNLTIFSGTASITNANLSGDCTTAGALATTCTKTNGVAFAPSATTDATNASNISSGTLGVGRMPATNWWQVPVSGAAASAAATAANTMYVWSFIIAAMPVTTGHLVFLTNTVDNSNPESFGIYDTNGNLDASTAASEYGSGAHTIAWTQGAVTLNPGRYYIGFTAAGTTYRYVSAPSQFTPACAASEGTTSGGNVLSASPAFTPPSDAWATSCTTMPLFALVP